MQMHIIEHLGTTQKERQSTTTLHTTLSKLHKNLQLPPPSQRELQPGMTAPWTRLLLEGGCPLAGTIDDAASDSFFGFGPQQGCRSRFIQHPTRHA
jgi:hypothetical protein